MTAHSDILTVLAPPIRLVIWLDKVFDAKQRKGEDIPPEFTRWLDLWRAIRSDQPAITDALTDAEWQEIGQAVEATGAYVNSKQPPLIDVPAKVEAY